MQENLSMIILDIFFSVSLFSLRPPFLPYPTQKQTLALFIQICLGHLDHIPFIIIDREKKLDCFSKSH